MKIQSVGGCTAYSYHNISPHQRQTSVDDTANFSASGKIISDAVATSQTAQNYLDHRSHSVATSENSKTASFDTNQGTQNMDIDAYFSPGGRVYGTASLFQTLPPLLFPSKNNIDELSNHISTVFPQFLAENNIPTAPSSITYNNEGQIQLPSDYAYASELKQALANNPTMSRELSTVNALTSHYVEIQKSLDFQQAYAATTTKAEASAVIAQYSYLFSDNRHYDAIALQFSESGRLSLTHDGEPLA